MKVKLLLILILTLLLTGCSHSKEVVVERVEIFEPQRVKIGDSVVNLELAVTPEEKARGLAGRKNIPADYGMLFIFDYYQVPAFWMKGMFSSIDIVWIKDDIIVGISDNLPIPELGGRLIYYYPPSESNRVLEVAAGTAQIRGWQTGDKVEYINP